MHTTQTESKSAELVLPLDAVDRGALPVVGGKGANLGVLTRAGLPVPPGFCVTTAAYEAVAAAAPGLADVLTHLTDAVAAAPVPDAVRAAITAAYDGGPVAVRSSATAEDLAHASFAGQQDTFLNVVGVDAVLDA